MQAVLDSDFHLYQGKGKGPKGFKHISANKNGKTSFQKEWIQYQKQRQ